MSAKSVTIYYAGFERFGGVFSHVRALELALQRSGWIVVVITLDSLPIWCKFLPHIVEKIVNFFNRPLGFLYKDRTTRVLYNLFFSRQVDLIIFEDIYISWNSKIPSITVLHAVWSDNLQSKPVSSLRQTKLIKREAEIIENIKHTVVTVSEPYFRYLVEDHFSGQLGRKIDVIELGVDQTKFQPKQLADQTSMIYVGALEARKNVIFLLEVFSRLTKLCASYKLTIIGDGPDMGLLKRYVQENQLAVRFLGSMSHSDVIDEIHRHGIYVHTSVKESFSYALLEAKLAGLKTCAYSKLQVPAEFIDEAIGSFDVDEWCYRILNLKTSSTKFIANKFTVENMVARTVALAL